MSKYIRYHPEGYLEVVHANLGLGATLQYAEEATRFGTQIPPPPEGYHVLEDITQGGNLTPAAKFIIRTSLNTTPIHCIAIFGSDPNVIANRREIGEDAHKGSIHHYFGTREEAISWMMQTHNFAPSNKPTI